MRSHAANADSMTTAAHGGCCLSTHHGRRWGRNATLRVQSVTERSGSCRYFAGWDGEYRPIEDALSVTVGMLVDQVFGERNRLPEFVSHAGTL